ncbi:MAG: hypothetical protein QOD93_2166 [Acetobacteraceae bacterium]|nr:hypothetical protein [Acetobacteraceae bacterium]
MTWNAPPMNSNPTGWNSASRPEAARWPDCVRWPNRVPGPGRVPRNVRRCATILLIVIMTLRIGAALAAPAGAALVIGEGQYAGQSLLPACSQAAQAVAARLQRLGFTVDQAIDTPAVNMRDVLDSFASRVAAAPADPVLVYVCAEAAVVGARLFMLPSDADLGQTLRPETQGVVMQTLFRILAGAKGSLVVELGVPAGTVAAPVATALRQGLPDGLHLAMAIGDGAPAGAFGRVLASEPAEGWEPLAAALRKAVQDAAPAITVYAPNPVPPPAPLPQAPGEPAHPLEASPEPGNPAASAPAAVAAAPTPSVPAEPAPAAPASPAPVSNAFENTTSAPNDSAPTASHDRDAAASPPAATSAVPQTGPGIAPPSGAPVSAAPAGDHVPPPAASTATVSGGSRSAQERAAQEQAAERKARSPEGVPDARTRRLQVALARRGFYRGPLDGLATVRTAQAIHAFQAALGDPPNGTLTQTEIVRLLNNW